MKKTQGERIYYIIKKSHKEGNLPIDRLSSVLEVTKRTIRNDLMSLNRNLNRIAEFRTKDGLIYLHVKKEELFNRFCQKLYREYDQLDTPARRIKQLFAKLLDTRMPLKIDDLCEQLYISRTTLVNDINRLRLTLGSYHLSIIGKPNSGIQLNGTEWNIRNYLVQNEPMLHMIPDLKKQTHLLIHAFARHYHMEEDVENEWLLYIRIMLHRIKTEHPLVKDVNKISRAMLNTKEYRKIDRFSHYFELDNHVKLSILEKVFMTIPILSRHLPVNASTVSLTPISADIQYLIRKIDQEIKNELNIQLDFSTVKNEFAYHLIFMLNRLVFDIRIHNTLIDEIKRKYPLSYEMANIAGRVVENICDMKPSAAEKGYLAYYFSIITSKQRKKWESVKRIAIVCDTGRGTARIIALQLDKIFSERVQKTLFSSHSVSKKILENFDLVITTVPLPAGIKVPIIKVRAIFDERFLIKEIQKVLDLKTIGINSNDESGSMISYFLHQETFFVLVNNKAYSRNLNDMVDHLINRNLVDKRFKDRLWAREKISETVFDHGIAFPHVINKAADSGIVLAIGVFPKSMRVHEKTIQIVFLLAVPESKNNEILLIHLYDELIHFSTHRDWINALSKAKNFIEAKNVINQCFTL